MGEFLAGRCLDPAKPGCSIRALNVHTIEEQLFARDGVGTLISAEIYEGLRTAGIDDVGGILRLITPLEQQGILVERSRERDRSFNSRQA